jgi:PPOX class probable F420-dependent enzyme
MNAGDLDDRVLHARLSNIARERIARLATVDEHGGPHVVPVCFAYTQRRLFIVLDAKPKRVPAAELRRVRNIRRNPDVQLLVDRYDDADWSKLSWSQVRGRARIVEHAATRVAALAALREKYTQYRAMDLDDAPLIEIDVGSVVSWSAS